VEQIGLIQSLASNVRWLASRPTRVARIVIHAGYDSHYCATDALVRSRSSSAAKGDLA